jgi:hypothetical protein
MIALGPASEMASAKDKKSGAIEKAATTWWMIFSFSACSLGFDCYVALGCPLPFVVCSLRGFSCV